MGLAALIVQKEEMTDGETGAGAGMVMTGGLRIQQSESTSSWKGFIPVRFMMVWSGLLKSDSRHRQDITKQAGLLYRLK